MGARRHICLHTYIEKWEQIVLLLAKCVCGYGHLTRWLLNIRTAWTARNAQTIAKQMANDLFVQYRKKLIASFKRDLFESLYRK